MHDYRRHAHLSIEGTSIQKLTLHKNNEFINMADKIYLTKFNVYGICDQLWENPPLPHILIFKETLN